MKQVIIVNKGLNMSAGKLAVQVAHASTKYFSTLLINNKYIPKDILDNWVNKDYKKIILQVDSEERLLNIIDKLNNTSLIKDEDYFVIYDNCYTELLPDENGKRLTCVGIKPMVIDNIKNNVDIYKIIKRLRLF